MNHAKLCTLLFCLLVLKIKLTQSQSSSVCVPGTYFTGTGTITSANCVRCQAGTYSTASGADNNSTCKDCEPGKITHNNPSVSLSSCITCTPGKYTSSHGKSECLLCPIGEMLLQAALLKAHHIKI